MAEKSTAGRTAIIQYSYEGTPVSFSRGEGVKVNAVQMAQPFGKMPKDFLKTKETKSFLKALSNRKKKKITPILALIYD